MKRMISGLLVALSLTFTVSSNSFAATEKEKSFVDAYKKAFESKDEKALQAFLYTKGADPEALEFYTMMMTAEMGAKITSIELRDLSPEDIRKASATMPSLSGGQSKLPVAPTKKLVYKIENKDANGTSTSSSESFVAEVDGKLLIPVPAAVK